MKPTHEIKAYYEFRGDHVYIRMFVGRANNTRALAGTLIISSEEFRAWANHTMHIQFVRDGADATQK